MKRVISVSILSLFIIACSNPKSPEQVLKGYIQTRLEGNQTKEKLANYLTGEMLTSLEELTDEEFKQLLASSDIKKKKFKLNLKKCSPDKCYLTYTLSYSSPKAGDKEYDLSVKKIAELDKIEENWKIAKVSDVKSYIESNKPIEVK